MFFIYVYVCTCIYAYICICPLFIYVLYICPLFMYVLYICMSFIYIYVCTCIYVYICIYAQTVHRHFSILIKLLHNLSQNSYKTLYIIGAEKMAKLTKCQLLKQEDLSLDPQYSHKTTAWQKLSVISALGGQKQMDPSLSSQPSKEPSKKLQVQ